MSAPTGKGPHSMIALALAFTMMATAPQGPSSRDEVMLRLRELERCWSAYEDSAQARALPKVESAAAAFSAGDESSSARELDQALAMLRGQEPWGGYGRLAFAASARLCGAAEVGLLVRTELLYGECHGWLELLTRFEEGGGASTRTGLMTEWGGQLHPVSTPIDTRYVEPGDRQLELSIWPGDYPARVRSLTISVVERCHERLAALGAAIDALPPDAPTVERETAKELHALLVAMTNGSAGAHGHPGVRLLVEAEQAVAAAARKEIWYGPRRPGEFRLALTTAQGRVRARVLVPAGLSKETVVPLVIALHGRAFEGDTWFDGYGGGRAIDLARERGWILAAPDCDGDEDAPRLEALVGALAERYPIDRERVMLLGHSRGGGSVLRAGRDAPRQFRAVAAIGSGLAPSDARALAKLPILLAAGDRDFARPQAEAFHEALVGAGSTSAEIAIHPQVEHWLAVTVALPAVFDWFDRQMK
jgi:predicted esterase